MGHDSNTGGGPRCGCRLSRRSGMPTLDAPDYKIARFLIERGLARDLPDRVPRRVRASSRRCAASAVSSRRPRSSPVPVPGCAQPLPLGLLGPAAATASRGPGSRSPSLLVIGLPQRGAAAGDDGWRGSRSGSLYQSIVNVGGTFYGFGWESLLLEAGFLAIFLGNAEIAPPLLVILAFRWLAFRVEFGAGLIKLRGDDCWRDLRCMDFHHETQPMPNPLCWFFHHLPRRLHRLEVLGNFFAQLVAAVGPVPAPAVRLDRGRPDDRSPSSTSSSAATTPGSTGSRSSSPLRRHRRPGAARRPAGRARLGPAPAWFTARSSSGWLPSSSSC